MKKILVLILSLFSFTIIAQETLVSNITEYNNAIKMAQPEHTIILKNGEWKNVKLNAYGKGIAGNHTVEITNTVFDSSYLVKNFVDLKGNANFIYNCLVHNSGFIKTSQGAKQDKVLFKNPKWEDDELFIPSKKSPLLKEKNKVATIGLKQQ